MVNTALAWIHLRTQQLVSNTYSFVKKARKARRFLKHYSLDAILAVGCPEHATDAAVGIDFAGMASGLSP